MTHIFMLDKGTFHWDDSYFYVCKYDMGQQPLGVRAIRPGDCACRMPCDVPWVRCRAIGDTQSLQVNKLMYVDKAVNLSAFTYFSQIRIVNEEDGYLAHTHGVSHILDLSKEAASRSGMSHKHMQPAFCCTALLFEATGAKHMLSSCIDTYGSSGWMSGHASYELALTLDLGRQSILSSMLCSSQAGHESFSTLRIITASMRRMAPSSTRIYR